MGGTDSRQADSDCLSVCLSVSVSLWWHPPFRSVPFYAPYKNFPRTRGALSSTKGARFGMAPFRASRPSVPIQSGMHSEEARRWEAALNRARDDDWIHYATACGWVASCLRKRRRARFLAAVALCGGVLMVLLHLARSGVQQQPSSRGFAGQEPSDDLQEADERDDIVDARGAQVLPSSSPPPATATKTVWATRRPLPGNDYHCEDSDGMGTDACQIRCGRYRYRCGDRVILSLEWHALPSRLACY